MLQIVDPPLFRVSASRALPTIYLFILQKAYKNLQNQLDVVPYMLEACAGYISMESVYLYLYMKYD